MSKVGGIDDPVWTLPPAKTSGSSPDRIERLFVILASVLVTLILGYLGLILPSVGGSIIIPTMIVFGVGLGTVVIGCIVMAYRPQWKPFAIGVAVVTILASIWTFEFSLPMQVQLSNATAQANAALSALERSPLNHHGTVMRTSCSLHTTGTVGPLAAPYLECPIFTPEGHIVTFKKVGNQPGALVYAQDLGSGVIASPDQCVRPLFGSWSMVTSPGTNSGAVCPFGYKATGGG